MFDINKCYEVFATEPNTAYFWSGLGPDGQNIAEKIAEKNGGTTLEMLMESHKDELISAGFPYDDDLGGFYFSKENARDWQAISQAYAEQASGDVHAVLGDKVRDGSVWNTKELPALEKNDNVNRVISSDPSSGKDKKVLLDKNDEKESYSPSDKLNTQNVASKKGGGARAPNENTRGNADNPPKEKNPSPERGKKPPQNAPPPQTTEPTQKGHLPKEPSKIDSMGTNSAATEASKAAEEAAKKGAEQETKAFSSAAGMGV